MCDLQSRLVALDEQWQFLVNKSAEKSQKLKEANKQQNFNTGIKDFDFWLSEVRTVSNPLYSRMVSSLNHTWSCFLLFPLRLQVEALLASEDYGKDLASVNNLLKKHQLLEADISAHEVTKLTHILIHSLVHLFTHSLVHSHSHSLTHTHSHTLSHSLTHSFIHSHTLTRSIPYIRSLDK